MTKCYQNSLAFPSVKRRKVVTDFTGGPITSDAGALLLSRVDEKLQLSRSIARSLVDSRRTASCDHSLLSLLKQRIYSLALGYEDLNDHQTLRDDLALQTAVTQDQVLASASTLCRLEQRADRQTAIAIHQVLFDQFVAAQQHTPEQLILDFDATDTLLHGEQEGRHYNGYYRSYCYLPLYVFCGRHLLVSYLRRSDQDAARHSWAILALLVKAIRQRWPAVKIVFRGDSGFCRDDLMRWCERQRVHYIVGIGRNRRLEAFAANYIDIARRRFELTNTKQRRFASVHYAARKWRGERRVIVKAEHTAMGANPRFVVTNLSGRDRQLYARVYCARGDMENRIKDQQLDLFADRTSCHAWWPNQFRQLLSGLAYSLLEGLRRLALADTDLARASPNRIRLTVLKIGAVVLRNTRRVRLLMSSAYPHQALFTRIACRLDTS